MGKSHDKLRVGAVLLVIMGLAMSVYSFYATNQNTANYWVYRYQICSNYGLATVAAGIAILIFTFAHTKPKQGKIKKKKPEIRKKDVIWVWYNIGGIAFFTYIFNILTNLEIESHYRLGLVLTVAGIVFLFLSDFVKYMLIEY